MHAAVRRFKLTLTTAIVSVGVLCVSVPYSAKPPQNPPLPPQSAPTSPKATETAPVALKQPTPDPIRRATALVTACSPQDPVDAAYYAKNGYEGRVTNAVAADPKVLPLGALVRIPGYAGGAWVPVDSKGGVVIRRSTRRGVLQIDVKYRTYFSAKKWGNQLLHIEILDPPKRR